MLPKPGERILITGGAGFLGSHLADALVERSEVRVVDNLSSGAEEHLRSAIERGAILRRGDLLTDSLDEVLADVDVVLHYAADPDVRTSARDPSRHFDQNVTATVRLLEACRRASVQRFVLASTSTVYGVATRVPTPEAYGPLEPVSLYGATKLAAEAMVDAFAHTYGIRAVVMRYANVVGGRSGHGVVFDLVEKLRRSPRHLEILGSDPGTTKSYVYVDDAIAGTLRAVEASRGTVDVYNLGSEDTIDVRTLADLVCEGMNLRDVTYAWTGGPSGGSGWAGDVPKMLLDCSKLRALGWTPGRTSAEAVTAAVKDRLASV